MRAFGVAEHDSHEYVTLRPDQIEHLLAIGDVRETEAGEALFTAGVETSEFFVVLDGTVDILGAGDADVTLITTHVAGQFLGELNLLIGQRPFVSAVVATPGRVLAIDLDDFTRFMRANPDIGDTVFHELVARRDHTHAGSGAAAIRIVGTRFSARTMQLRVFAARSQIPCTWTDLDEVDDPAALLAELGVGEADGPVVLTPLGVLHNPTTAEFAAHLGLAYDGDADHIHDVVVVGLGPGGLAAAVVAVAEGLDALCLDAVAVGGQAAASSRIENYLGFPNGISGEQLIEAASVQAQRLGARLIAPCEVVALRSAGDHKIVDLADGTTIQGRALVIATGARYRKLEVDDLARFEGAGVYYATSNLETRACLGHPVVVVGGGNSAGQAALSLARSCASVTLVVRRDSLADTMSHYLVTRIESDDRIHVRYSSVVRSLVGASSVEHATIEHTGTGAQEEVPCRGVFCFIGAVPETEWIGDDIARDRSGFILTDRDLPATALRSGAFSDREPLPYETSVPGVFAVGDVRATSLKRVAAAVGEGSTVVRSLMEHLGPGD
ncbi:MAG: FAD-dependent oxidoreductase [Actinomycetota bacterium]